MSSIIKLGWRKPDSRAAFNADWKKSDKYREIVRRDHIRSHDYTSDGHLITFAPTGSGKGVSCVIPTLLDYKGPTVVLDPKGENFAVTADFRRRSLGQDIYLFDPYRVSESWAEVSPSVSRCRINPFDLIGDDRDSPGARARVMADALVPDDPGSREDKFWDTAARNLLAGLIAYTIESPDLQPEQRNLLHISEILAGDIVEFVLRRLSEDEEAVEKAKTRKLSSFVSKAFGNFVNIGSANQARDSVIFVLNTYIENLATDEISDSLSETSLDLNNLRNLSKPYTLYLVIPPEKLQSDANVLRLIIVAILKVIIARRKNPSLKELLVLDECAQLGQLNELRQVVTLLRGYGVLAWMFFQDLSQLQTTYEDWKSIINNCGVVQIFGYERLLPAREISELLGAVDEKEIMRLGATRQVVSMRGERTKILRKLNYLQDEYYEGRSASNPYHQKTGNEQGRKSCT